MRWEGKTYLDCALPFSLRSAPKVFSAVADALSWAMVYEGIEDVLHYLDDFLFFGPPQSPHCQTAMRTVLRVCDALDLPVATEKVDGPSLAAPAPRTPLRVWSQSYTQVVPRCKIFAVQSGCRTSLAHTQIT